MNRLYRISSVRLLMLLLGASLLAPWIASAPAQDAPAGVGEIDLRVERFGPGNVCRQGEWAGLYVAVDDRGLEQREIILRLQGRDADGDRPLYDTVVTSNPGTRQAFWLYTRLPFRFDQSDTLAVSAWAAEASRGSDQSGALAYRATRQLAYAEIRPSRVLAKTESMIGVLGPWHFGLGAYGIAAQASSDYALTGHELTRIITGLEHAEIPHRYQGLVQFDALVWGAARREADPLRLSTDQARAIREWVTRGGHLIVVLPTVGQEWLSNANPLADLLPSSMPGELREGFDLNELVALLSRDADVRLPTSASVRVFEADKGAPLGAAVRVLEGPDGACLVTRRIVGAGAVSVIGIDLSEPALVSAGLPDPDQFWHRVLGRRGVLDPDTPLARRAVNASRTRRSFDADIPNEIAKSGRAYVGVLLGFVVFALYWVVAGPGGFGLLARAKKKQHAWVAFVAAIGVFTAIAWTGATLIRPKRVEAVHLTFLHEVHAQGVQRARTWASVLIPSYGDATISLAGEPDAPASQRMTGLVSPWEPPASDVITQASFPDNRAYRVDARSPNEMRVPTRSTVKQIRADWSGAPRWNTIEALRDPGQIGDALISLGEGRVVYGRLAHALPGDLEDVTILIVRRQEWIPRPGVTIGDSPVSVVNAYRLTAAWAAGEANALSLESVTSREAGLQSTFETFAERLLKSGKLVTADLGPARSGSVSDRFTAVLLFPQLAPPTFNSNTATADLAQRSETHGLDLGHWFTQPCVIVIGHLTQTESKELPVPLEVNGRPAQSGGGRTVVSWVYPLPDAPPEYKLMPSEIDDDEPSSP